MVVHGHSFLPLVSFPVHSSLTIVLELIIDTTDFFHYMSLSNCVHIAEMPVHLITVQWLHLSFALLSLLGQDATGIAYNTQHLSELSVSQLEDHTVQYIQYHVKSFDTLILFSQWSMTMLECLIYSPFSGEYMLDFRII